MEMGDSRNPSKVRTRIAFVIKFFKFSLFVIFLLDFGLSVSPFGH